MRWSRGTRFLRRWRRGRGQGVAGGVARRTARTGELQHRHNKPLAPPRKTATTASSSGCGTGRSRALRRWQQQQQAHGCGRVDRWAVTGSRREQRRTAPAAAGAAGAPADDCGSWGCARRGGGGWGDTGSSRSRRPASHPSGCGAACAKQAAVRPNLPRLPPPHIPVQAFVGCCCWKSASCGQLKSTHNSTGDAEKQ